VELLQQFAETGKAKRVGNIKPRLDNPASINLPPLYFLSALDTGVLTIGSANAILNPFVSQDLPDSKHFSHLHPNDYSAGRVELGENEDFEENIAIEKSPPQRGGQVA
jgi:hypothetical protein